jgi:glycosyltransferase involved in cell wall biosynthesis
MASTSTEPFRYVMAGTSARARVSGATLAFDLAVQGARERGLRVSVVDFAKAGRSQRVGAFSGGRALRVLGPLLGGAARLTRADGLYVVMSSSRAGFLRDAALVWPALALGRATVLHLHGGGYDAFYAAQPRWLRALIRATLARVDAIVVLGEALRGQFSFLPRDNRVVVPNGLPRELEPPERTERKPLRPVRLLYLSNLIESKGYLELVRACAILRDEGVEVACDLCGEFVRTAQCSAASAEEARGAFLRLVDELGLRDAVRWRGVVTGAEKQALLERAHLLVLPTAYPGEGQPLSIIEALAFGVPVVATRFRGIPDQVIDDVSGYLIPSSAPEEIARAVRKAVADEERYAHLSEGARSHYLQNFRQSVHVDRMAAVLQYTANRAAQRAAAQ